jgi:hypothetical protein
VGTCNGQKECVRVDGGERWREIKQRDCGEREQVSLAMYDTLILAVVGIPIVIWVMLTFILAGKRYEMDCGLGNGSFFGIFTIYRHLALITFAVALLFAIKSAEHGWPPATIVCGAAALYDILFIAWTAYCYEGYLHSKYPKNPPMGTPPELQAAFMTGKAQYVGPTNYSAPKYALTLTLGFSSLALFVIGVILFLATVMGR